MRSSKMSYLVAVGAIVVAVCFMVATALLVDEMARSHKMFQLVERELVETRETIEQLSIKEDVCLTKECIKSAAHLLESIDEKTDPCDDFYQFACGGWKRKNPIPKKHSRISQFSTMENRLDQYIAGLFKINSTATDFLALNKTRTFYSACVDLKSVDEVGLTPIITLMDTYGKWPLITSNWSERDFDWRKASAAAAAIFDISVFFEVSNFLDANDTSKEAIWLDQPELGIPLGVLKGEYAQFFRTPYEIFIHRVAKEFRKAVNFNTPSNVTEAHNATESVKEEEDFITIDVGTSYFFETDEELISDINDIIDFQTKLAEILTTGELRKWNMTRMYNLMSLDQLQKWTKQAANATSTLSRINWYEFMNDVYSTSDVFVSRRERIIVMEPAYLHRLVHLLDQTPPRIVANYFYWKLLLHLIRHAPTPLLEASDIFWSYLSPLTSEDRDSWCLEQVDDLLGEVVSAKYVQDMFSTHAKEDVERMVKDLMDSFTTLLQESSWMDEATKSNAVLKASAMNVLVGHPDWMRNNTLVDLKYEEVNPSRLGHFENYVQVKGLSTKRKLGKLREAVNRKESWFSLPNVVNAFYMPWLNVANLPAGILESPFYSHGRLAASNYGGIGFIIGHEITHGFDSNGHKRDKDGREISWWTNNTLEKYHKRINCIVEQYSNYSLPELAGTDSYFMNGTQTLGENIADNGAIRESFRAYKKHIATNGREPKLPGLEHFTSEQIFFLSFAHGWCRQSSPKSLRRQIKEGVHSPARFRAIGALSNSDDFIEHFKCPAGSRMNRVNKCIVW